MRTAPQQALWPRSGLPAFDTVLLSSFYYPASGPSGMKKMNTQAILVSFAFIALIAWCYIMWSNQRKLLEYMEHSVKSTIQDDIEECDECTP
ncbi:ORF089 [Infectious spleen and kidney necrosis virus]|uniref:ORF092R n=3 Tax=Infectious spleen and kidney necrosis virus TaxID=180170 RepID=Q8QUL8_ISKNN|nr:ORF092R [Infectious spleen and kidney necrosis virus]QIQ54533.1 ORF089 [Angelfish iridovirus AFIV-16]AAL98816.1 ORF092R [Infectious spleen and kidney necrosis virus]AMM04535.1 ORF098R [Infectious spleen and kidney necrosis virus]QXE50782.1 ORF089 [Infectious spleen and kidney necrosis virus]QXE50904.1 ORF089 [Infectious spleen and kidney necrosis virus]